MASILVVEDEREIRTSIAGSLEMDGHQVSQAESMARGGELSRGSRFDAVVTDVQLGDGTGVELLGKMREEGFDGLAVVITAFGTIENAVEAMKYGADEYLQKPISLEELSLVIKRGLENRRVKSRLSLYERIERIRAEHDDEIMGVSPAWIRTRKLAERFASIPVPEADEQGESPTILLLGETGTGKGVIARHIHTSDPQFDPEKPSPFIHVNCAALPPTLIESELFGHEKGAFTDAASTRRGLFEMAEGGTIFLDEIGELPPEMQAKMLLVVEQGVFRRIGGDKEHRIRARIIAATNQDLDELVDRGEFRRDLLYRLNALTVRVPPLRERDQDAAIMAEAMLDRIAHRRGDGAIEISEDAREAIIAYVWPGNVRELINVLKRAAILCDQRIIQREDLQLRPAPVASGTDGSGAFLNGGPLPTIEELEKQLILKALEKAGGNVSNAARLIGLNRGALRYRIERLDIRPTEFQEAVV